MKTTKRLVSCLLALAVCAAMSACGEKSYKDKEINDWTESDFEEAVEDIEEADKKHREETKKEEEKTETEKIVLSPLDPFEYLTVSFTGFSPNGEVIISNKGSAPTSILFTADKQMGLANGDVITVTANAPQAERDGYELVETTKQFTVEGLEGYATDLDDIPEDIMQKIISQAQDSLTSQSQNFDHDIKAEKDEYIGCYILSPKAGSEFVTEQNMLYCVFKTTLTGKGVEPDSTEETDFKEDVYRAVKFHDIKILSDGTCSADLTGAEVVFNGVELKHRHKYFDSSLPIKIPNGFPDIESLFDSCVSSNLGQYSYVGNIE